MDKQELISVFKTNIAEEEQDKEGRQLPTDSWLNGYENGRIDALEFGYKLAEWLDEPEITTEQAWEKIAEKFEEGPKELCATLVSALPPYNLSEKPEIPKFVADWIEEVKQRGCGLADALNCFESPIMPEKVKQWIQFDFAVIGCHHDNQELLAKAWLNGYTIEKAPVWIVKAPYDRYFGGFLEKGQHAEINFSHINRDNAQKFEDKNKAKAVATLIDGEVEEWSE